MLIKANILPMRNPRMLLATKNPAILGTERAASFIAAIIRLADRYMEYTLSLFLYEGGFDNFGRNSFPPRFDLNFRIDRGKFFGNIGQPDIFF